MSSLKELAKEAKRRMIAHDYATRQKESIKVAPQERLEPDKSMEAIVAEIAASEDIVVNPLGMLVDQAYYDTLDEVEQERYVLLLAKKYQTLLKKVNIR